MKVSALMTDIARELPEAPVRDFFRLVNDEVQRLWEMHDWAHYRASTTFSMPETFTNCTLTNGSATLTIPTAYFQSLVLEGQGVTVTVGGTDYTFTVESVTSTTSLTLDDTWDQSTTSAATVVFARRSDWRLPTDYRIMRAVYAESTGTLFHDPHHYTLDIQTSDDRELLYWHVQPVNTQDVVVEYYRKPTIVDGPNDTLDIPEITERLLYLMIMGRILNRVATRGIEDPYGPRREENQRMQREAVDYARRLNIARRRPTAVNQPTLLKLNRYG